MSGKERLVLNKISILQKRDEQMYVFKQNNIWSPNWWLLLLYLRFQFDAIVCVMLWHILYFLSIMNQLFCEKPFSILCFKVFSPFSLQS